MKYFKLYWYFLKLNFSQLFTYRSNFFTSLGSSLGWGFISILSMFLITARVTSFWGWSRNELLLLNGVYSILVGTFHMAFSQNFSEFSLVINKGRLDSILVKPISSQFFLSFKRFNFIAFSRVIIGIIFTSYMIYLMKINLTIFSVLQFLFFLVSGLVLLYSIWYLIMTITVWFSTLDNLRDFLVNFENISRYPTEMLLKGNNLLLLSFVPISIVSTIPTKALLGKLTLIETLLLLLLSISMLTLCRKFWQFALRFYTSASG